MAIEIPNAIDAGGLFDGKLVPTFNPPILSSNGIQPYDSSTTALLPKGGFTRVGGVAPNTLDYYHIKLVQPIDGLEGVPMVTKATDLAAGANNAIPAAIISPDGAVNVNDSHDIEGGTDFSFSLMVFRIATGPNFSPSE